MSHIGQQIEFSSRAFPACEEDKQLVNHETMHGYALARNIADRLPAHGFDLARMVAEDWGWWCEVANDGFTLAYACGTQHQIDGAAEAAADDAFVVFVIPDKPRIRRWFKSIDVAVPSGHWTVLSSTLSQPLFCWMSACPSAIDV